MMKLMGIISRRRLAFAKDRSGATAIEYGLLAAGISVVIIGTVFLLGPQLKSTFDKVLTEISKDPV